MSFTNKLTPLTSQSLKSSQVSSFLIGITRHEKGYISVTIVARGGGGGGGGWGNPPPPNECFFGVFVGTFGNLSVHVSRQAVSFVPTKYLKYRQNIPR